MEASAEGCVSYADLSNEGRTHEYAWKRDAHWRECGIAVVPGAGFGTYLAEVLAEHALRTIDQPQKVSLTSLASGRTSKSPGVTASSQAVLASGSWRFRSGTLVRLRGGRAVETSETSSHLTLHTGDLFALRRTTAATDIQVFAELGLPRGQLLLLLPLLRVLASLHGVRPLRLPSHRRTRPRMLTSTASTIIKPRLRVTVEGSAGDRASFVLTAGSGTAFAAAIYLEVPAALAAEARSGCMTPLEILGSNPARHLPGVHISPDRSEDPKGRDAPL